MRARWVAVAACVAALAGCQRSEAPPAAQGMAPSAGPQPAPPAAESVPGQAAAPRPEPAPGAPKGGEDAPRSDEKPGAALEQAPRTLEEAEKQLDQAVALLDQITGARSGAGAGAPATPLAAGDRRCADACKAMDSLRRAAAAVCRLAGEGSARCTRARTIVKDSEARVAACGCEPEKE